MAALPTPGGWPIKMLADLEHLHVHVAAAEDPAVAEEAVLRAFMAGVDPLTRAALADPALPLPYANLELTKGLRKRHGIRGAKQGRAALVARPAEAPRPAGLSRVSTAATGTAFSLHVTAADIASGQIRVTREPKRALDLPRVQTTITVDLRGERLQVPWDPRLGPDQARSGLLRVGREAARRHLHGPVTLTIHRDRTGGLVLG